MTEIHNFEIKQAVLLEVRRKMSTGEHPTRELHDAYIRIPQDEVIAIFRFLDFFGPPVDTPQRTWADVVRTPK
jgi:hypothetical protein